MQISAGLCWLVAALILGGIDMVAGTFYLLMIGLGCLAGAVVYWVDLSLAWQCAAASVCAVAGCLMVFGFKAKHPEKDDAVSHPDAGHIVTVTKVSADGTAEVMYRGASWRAKTADGSPLTAGSARIVRVDGAALVVEPIS